MLNPALEPKSPRYRGRLLATTPTLAANLYSEIVIMPQYYHSLTTRTLVSFIVCGIQRTSIRTEVTGVHMVKLVTIGYKSQWLDS